MMFTRNSFFYLIIISLLPFLLIHSQKIPSKAYSDMSWRLVGPFRAGWGTVCEGIPEQLNTFYFGGAGGGIWRTSDAGRTWKALMQHEGSSAIGALAIAPSDPKIIYAGTGQVAWRYDILEGDGVYRSTDGGETWKNTGLKETGYIGRILVDPGNSDKLLVAALGHVFGSGKERGVYKSTNGSKTWEQTLFVNDSTGAVDLAYDELNPDIIYAALWQMRMHPWLDYYMPQVGLRSGIYKSTDGGNHWEKIIIDSLKDVPLGRIGLAVARGSKGKIVYASIDTRPDKRGLYRSDDGGKSWKLVNKNRALANSYFSRLTIDPNNPDKIYVMDRSIHLSTDGGKKFEIFKGAPGGDDYHFLWINPHNPDYMITASDQGTVVTVNNGESWSSWYNQPTGQFYRVAADNRFPYRIYSGQQDNGTVEILSRGPYGAIDFRDWHPVGADERDMDIPKPGNPDIVFGSGLGGSLHRFDEITRQSINVSPWAHGSYAAKPNTVKYRYSWITPIAFSPVGENALYFGAQYLFKSTDDGNNWKIISPDLSRKSGNSSNCDNPNLNEAAACGYGVIWSIAPSPLSQDVIWIGTDDGLIHLTTDGGKNWDNVTPPEVPVWGRIDAISPSPFSVNSAYAAVNLHRLDKFTPMILKTSDDGQSWKEIINGLPSDEYTTVVRADTKQHGLLFAGTNRSIYVSFDDGKNWQSLSLNFPTALISDLLVHQNDLIACTQGRAIWVLDDLSPLQQLSKEVTNKDVYLFKPADAYRLRFSESHDTPLPPSTPLGQNPPTGAIIDYWLKKDVDSVKLSIYDSSENLIRTFSSTEQPESLPAYRYFDKRWLTPPMKLSTEKGMHRFVWDLRFPRPKALHYGYSIAAVWKEETPVHPEGLLIMPGKYKAVLKVMGKECSQEFTVKIDPRINATMKDLKAQLELGMRIDSLLSKTTELYNCLNNKLNDDKSSLSESGIDSLKNIKTKLGSINGALAFLASVDQTADAAPTQGVIDVFDSYKQQFEELKVLCEGNNN
jgi:photosystem II stability/assembly factor-like uncharacterized protein